MATNTAYALTGGNGSTYVTDTSPVTGDFKAIQAVGDAAAVISNSYTTGNISGFSTDITISAGQTIYGRFSSVALASGKVLLYNT